MLTAFGQHNAQRAGGNFRILEKQFVKIAHPVEQQRIRVCTLDFDKLRHHRRRAVFRCGVWGAVHDRYASKGKPRTHALKRSYPTFYPLRRKDC